MAGVLNEMVKLSLQEGSVDTLRYLDSDNWGMRMAAYVYISIYPRLEILSDLISSVKDAGKQPFVQYRGIEAISKILERYHHGQPEVGEGIKELRLLRDSLGKETLRYAELAKILIRYDQVTASG